ncbi:unnamed protein product [Didymodactylos carnosus]|uniref:Uncharacterized protein n=1 Tax=Didymodactylos carnosus TaxID=1234261 RepID=A0A8S2S879_9BILA|nr:unnamed protein product [Didymodactylos carnosus]CAF4213722.1 unnamed protein product [Didymodactylos carnosus]
MAVVETLLIEFIGVNKNLYNYRFILVEKLVPLLDSPLVLELKDFNCMFDELKLYCYNADTHKLCFRVLSNTTFQSQTRSFIKQFQLYTTQTFLRTLSFVQKTTQANSLMSGLLTNFRFVQSPPGFTQDLFFTPSLYVNKSNLTCSCDVSSKCLEPSAIYNNLTLYLEFVVPGFYLSCFIVDSLLQSILECFYQRQCINEIQSWMTTNFTIVSPPDATLKSKYRPTTPVQEIFSNLTIEQWLTTILFSSYYDECHPTECTFSYVQSFDLLYTIVALLALTGGLTKILKVIVPNVVRLIR